ncbi:hypothetical protein TRFO_14093 [Tritrichomonas foetus]|uniref:Uncharacterized protein n=1 Tax=Tritrichomonas foetus TaxID=1144522 RepID=A0A1J4L0S5_9EUKA|nr:hypothetical protein TRFO_14093 [Tritrichomonas foetus]|eukprot:OHT15469.1 hypothetical protein TRFO_14093 [Tritrichomonas foetus]
MSHNFSMDSNFIDFQFIFHILSQFFLFFTITYHRIVPKLWHIVPIVLQFSLSSVKKNTLDFNQKQFRVLSMSEAGSPKADKLSIENNGEIYNNEENLNTDMEEEADDEGGNEEEEEEGQEKAELDDVIGDPMDKIVGEMGGTAQPCEEEEEGENQGQSQGENTSTESENHPEEESHVSPRPPTTRSCRSARTRQRNSQPVDQDEVSGVSAQFLAGEKVTCEDPDVIGAAITDLEEQRDENLNNGNFEDSVKYHRAIENAKQQQLDTIKRQCSAEMQEDVSSRRAETQESFDNFLKDMKEREQQLEDKFVEQQNALKSRQEKDLEDFDNEWNSEEKLRQYNRSSQRLRVLRTQQALLLRTKRFDEAVQVSKIADGVAEQETQQNHEHMIADYNMSRSIVEAKHAEELDTLLRAQENKRSEFKSMREIMSRPYQNRFSALQIEENIAKDPERVWLRRHRNDQNDLTSRQLKNSKVNVRLNVAEFNTLPLPPLPRPGSTRKSVRSSRGDKTQKTA